MRAEFCHPLPVPVHDWRSQTRAELQADLFERLARHDAWGVISAGPADSNARLVSVLTPLNLPLLITLASAVRISGFWNGFESSTRTLPFNALRLVASNDQQAQAILAKVRALLDAGIQGPVRLITESDKDLYCADLSESIRQQSRLGFPRVALEEVSLHADGSALEDGLVIYVGYRSGLQRVPGSPNKHSGLIVSDGCARDDVERREGDRRQLFLSSSAISPEQCGLDAYEVLSTLWRRTGAPGYAAIDGPRATERLRSALTVVRSFLEADLPDRYNFAGVENTRGGYIISRVAAPHAQRAEVKA